jgi:hypothetical protein
MRGLVLLALPPLLASIGLAGFSCDSGGEPPETGDSGTVDGTFSDGPPGGDASSDAGVLETSTFDAPEQEDVVVVEAGPCGDAGDPCCSTGATACVTGDVCSGGVCTGCGAPGLACCDLNLCSDGGCCSGTLCTMEGKACTLADGATCSGGSCGSCGALGEPCCGTTCTAMQTICSVDAGKCAECGNGGQPCCVGPGGSSCAGGSLVCDSTGRCIQ